MLSALFQHPIQGIMPTTVGIGANTPTKWKTAKDSLHGTIPHL